MFVGEKNEAYEQIKTLCTKSLFLAALHRIQKVVTSLTESVGLENIEVKLEEGVQYLLKGQGFELDAFAVIVLYGPLPETGHIAEVGNIVLKETFKFLFDY